VRTEPRKGNLVLRGVGRFFEALADARTQWPQLEKSHVALTKWEPGGDEGKDWGKEE
jgi:hypothetical protein